MSQIITLIDKPIEEMTLDELKRERRVHVWVISVYESFRNRFVYKNEKRDENRSDYSEYRQQFLDGELTREEYRKYMYLSRMWRGRDKKNEALVQDKVDYIDMEIIARKAIIQLIDERIEDIELADKPRKPKQRKLPASYGYDPRKNNSRTNYPRLDWGHTRENHYEHTKRRKVKKRTKQDD